MKKSIIFLLVILLSNGWLFANHWIPNDSNFEDNMTLTGIIQINDVEQQSTTLEVGVFCGEECRGSGIPTYFIPTQRYVVQLTIFGELGDQLTFKLFDHALGQELNLVSPEAVSFNANGYGSLSDPYILNFTGSVTEMFAITAIADPTEGGTIGGTGLYEEGQTCTLVASPNENYAFVNWTEEGVEVSTNNTYSFTVDADRALTAHFISSETHWIPNGAQYEDNMTLTGVIQINGEEQQSTTLEVGVFCGEECRSSGIPTYFIPTQRYIVQLTIFGELGDQLTFKLFDHALGQELELVSPEAVSFIANGYGSLSDPYILNFTGSVVERFAITAIADPTEGGTIMGTGLYEEGQSCTLVATANENYAFVNWTENGVEVSTNDTYSFTVDADRTLTAHFTSSETHWIPNDAMYEDNMTLTGVIQINGVEQQSTSLEVGVFCGEECRGAQLATYFFPTQRYLVQLIVFGETGDQLTFKLYDHALGQELDLTSPEAVTFVANGYGSLGNPYILNFTGSVTQTYTLPIAGYDNPAGNYYLIAPPIDDVNPAEIVGMTVGDYDLYYFDQGEELEWRNYKSDHFNLESGKGYLYAHKTDVTLTFTGTPYNGDGKVTLRKIEGASFEGWNLVGNPFPQVATIDRDCYVMNAAGSEIVASTSRTVNPMQGVFVIAASDGEDMTFVPQNSTDESSKIVINVSKNRAEIIDRAIVRFEGNSMLPKLMLNPDNTKLYVSQDSIDYAVVSVEGNNNTPVCFKAKENGTYTLTVDINSLDLDYLHLFDNKTGTDVDLLQVPSYTFDARTTDYAERFNLIYWHQ